MPSSARSYQASPWQHEASALLRLAWPLMLSMLAHTVISTTDVVMIGWLGSKPLAASALAVSFFNVALLIGLGLVSAVTPMMSQALGRKRHAVRDVRRTARQCIWVMLTILPVVWIALWHIDALLLWLGHDPELVALATIYSRALQWRLAPLWLFMLLRSFLATLERPKPVMVLTIVAIVVNIILDKALIFGTWGAPRLEMQGAGIASCLSSSILCLGVLAYVFIDRKTRRFHIFARFWRPDWRRYREVWRLGAPTAFSFTVEFLAFAAAVQLMGRIGALELAAYTIAIQIAILSFQIPMGLSQATTVRVGRHLGLGDKQQVSFSGWLAIGITAAIMLALMVLILCASGPLVQLFLTQQDANAPVVAALARKYLMVTAAFLVFNGLQTVAAGALRGLKDADMPMLFTTLGYWLLGAPLAVALALWTPLRGFGVLVAMAMALAVITVLMTRRWAQRKILGLVRVKG